MQPLIGLFFAIFKISKSAKEVSAKQGWASFGQRERLFTTYSDSVKDFKGKYFYFVVENDVAYLHLRHMNNSGNEVFQFSHLCLREFFDTDFVGRMRGVVVGG